MKSLTCASLLLAAIHVQAASAKIALAHFMVQESYAYTVDEWKLDIAAAQQIGLDGFALNWIPPDCNSPGDTSVQWQIGQIRNAYAAANTISNPPFYLMHSFDMSYFSCETGLNWNQTFMVKMINELGSQTSQLKWNGSALVSTFDGETGPPYGVQFFQGLKSLVPNASFAPAFDGFSIGARGSNGTVQANSLVQQYPANAIDGFLNWDCWPDDGNNKTADIDIAFQTALKDADRPGPYIMAVSPWQFKNVNSSDGSFLAYSDTLFDYRFQQLVNGTINPDMIELLTWNDYGESHYLRKLPSEVESAPDYIIYANGMENYVQGFNHNPWRIMAKYYITWWKTGKPGINQDQVVYWYRVHPAAATCSEQPYLTISGTQYPVDAVFAWALVQSPATIEIDVGSNKNWTFTADASGPVLNMVPFPKTIPAAGITPSVRIVRNGNVVQQSSGSLPINATCDWYNFNPVVNLAGTGVNA